MDHQHRHRRRWHWASQSTAPPTPCPFKLSWAAWVFNLLTTYTWTSSTASQELTVQLSHTPGTWTCVEPQSVTAQTRSAFVHAQCVTFMTFLFYVTMCVCVCVSCTARCSEIGFFDVTECTWVTHASGDVREPISLHQAVYVCMCMSARTRICVCHNEKKCQTNGKHDKRHRRYFKYCKTGLFRTHSIFVFWALRPFVRRKFLYSCSPLRILWLALYLLYAFYFVRKRQRTKYTKINTKNYWK